MMQVAFYVTPILFSGDMLRGKHHWIVEFNPLAYLIDTARQPLLGVIPSPLTWAVSTSMAIIWWLLALTLTGRYHNRIPYWA